MTYEKKQRIKPFISLSIVLFILFFVVMTKMEIRRAGYEVLRLSREKKTVMASERQQSIVMAQLTRPQHIEKYAQVRLDLQKATQGQIIQMTHNRVVLRE